MLAFAVLANFYSKSFHLGTLYKIPVACIIIQEAHQSPMRIPFRHISLFIIQLYIVYNINKLNTGGGTRTHKSLKPRSSLNAMRIPFRHTS